jgi:ubiquinol-cytochrome c reductase iron-sulfur subunit
MSGDAPMTDMVLAPGLARRDFLFVASGAVAATGTLAAAWPFVNQMEPTAAAVAAGGPLSIDLSPIAPGQQIVMKWRALPFFIVRRTPGILEDLKSVALTRQLRDARSEEPQQPAYATNWSRSINPEFLVVVGICTHLGCIPAFSPARGSLLPDMPGGYLCHCHGSKYDMAGRVFKGVPAPFNLAVPPHHFPDAKTLVVGENPPGSNFALDSVKQI